MNKFTTIFFPFLNWEWDPPSVLQIGPLSVHLYAICIVVGMLLAIAYGCSRGKEFGFTSDDLIDGALCVIPFAILCARLYYCVFAWEEGGYRENPLSILYIWQGGLAIYGGVLGAIVGVAVYAKVKKLSLPALLDIVSLGFFIGQSCGRWGNFFNREAFGAPTESFFRMGLFNTATQAYEFYHPTFLYESVWNLTGFVILHFLSKRRQYDGQIALGYAAWYGLGRAMIEGLRMDSLYWGPIRVSQALALLSLLAAATVLIFQAFRPHDREKLFKNKIR